MNFILLSHICSASQWVCNFISNFYSWEYNLEWAELNRWNLGTFIYQFSMHIFWCLVDGTSKYLYTNLLCSPFNTSARHSNCLFLALLIVCHMLLSLFCVSHPKLSNCGRLLLKLKMSSIRIWNFYKWLWCFLLTRDFDAHFHTQRKQCFWKRVYCIIG